MDGEIVSNIIYSFQKNEQCLLNLQHNSNSRSIDGWCRCSTGLTYHLIDNGFVHKVFLFFCTLVQKVLCCHNYKQIGGAWCTFTLNKILLPLPLACCLQVEVLYINHKHHVFPIFPTYYFLNIIFETIGNSWTFSPVVQ